MAEALRAYTYGAAYAMHAEDRIGTPPAASKPTSAYFDRNLYLRAGRGARGYRSPHDDRRQGGL